jgi:diguanylate cyclase (GGDEF)-like protein
MPVWAMTLELVALLLLLVTYGLLWRLRPAAPGTRLTHTGILVIAFTHVWYLLASFYPAGPWYRLADVTWPATLGHSIGVGIGLVCISVGLYCMFRSVWSTDEELRRTVEELERVNARLAELSATDELTGVYNYRFFVERLKIEMSVAQRQDMPFSCAIVDIDHFKMVNDTYGHDSGDRVLAATASSIRGKLRPSDAVGRLGGDEFGVLLPSTDYDTALLVAERMRMAVHANSGGRTPARPPEVTVSIGVASFPEEQVSEGTSLLKLADRALYAAKEGGRDRVVLGRDLDRPNTAGRSTTADG